MPSEEPVTGQDTAELRAARGQPAGGAQREASGTTWGPPLRFEALTAKKPKIKSPWF